MIEKFFAEIRFLIIIGCFFLLASGCNEEQPQSPKVITKKVVKEEAKQNNKALKPEKIKATSLAVADKKDKKFRVPAGLNNKDKKANDILTVLEILEAPALHYNPQGKIDPFSPLFGDKPDTKLSEKKEDGSQKKRIPRTPLEMIDLNQLTLTAVIISDNENRALVEESSGKGYIIEKGTSIGTHYGKVVKIKKDRIIIEEETKDMFGKVTIDKREMKLQKPFGDN